MNAPAAPAAADSPTATLSLAQLREALWSDERLGVYAMLRAARIQDLRERLATADVDDWDSLWTGELEPAERQVSPHLVRLRRGSRFADWLSGEAAGGFPDWGVLLRSARPFLALRSHGRALCQARLPDGEELRLDAADPALLQALLPRAPADQLGWVFGAIESILVPGATVWTRWQLSMGQLQAQRIGVLGQA